MAPVVREVRVALRKLGRAPLFTVVSIATLAVGIGANAAIFAILSNVLLAPLPFEESERIAGVWHTAPGIDLPDLPLSDASYFHYRENAESYEAFATWSNTEVNVIDADRAERVEAIRVTADFFRVLRLSPVAGRDFSEADDQPGASGTVMLTWPAWQRWFGGESAIGRTLRVDGVAHEIIGILPRDFIFVGPDVQLFLPRQFDRADVNVGSFNDIGIARLRPGVTFAQAEAEITRLGYEIPDVYPGSISRSMLVDAQFAGQVHALKEDVVEDIGRVMWVLFGTVGIVLLIACANVANLFLVRAEARHREVAVRTALGGSRASIARDSVIEGIVLAASGGALGLVIAWLGLRALTSLGLDNLPRLHEVGIDPAVLAFTAVLCGVAGIGLGLFPMLRFRSLDLITSLREGGRGASGGRERHRARDGLVVTQLALALVLLVGAGLMLRTFGALREVDPGFQDPASLLTARLSFATGEFPESERVALLHQELIGRLTQIPGVTSAAMTTSPPLGRSESRSGTWIEDHPTPKGAVPPVHRTKWVGEGYFTTLGVPVVAGRTITWADMLSGQHLAVVNEAFARTYWSDPAQAIGKRLRQDEEADPWSEIVGVVGNVRDEGLDKDAPAILYMPIADRDTSGELVARRGVNVILRAAGPDAAGLAPALREAVRAVHPNLPLANVETVETIVERSMARTSFLMAMLAIAALVALFLGTVGIYGVISYVVSQRTREIGVRIALGAETGRVSGMVLRQGLALAAVGVGIGIVASIAVTRLMRTFLYGVTPLDPLTFLAVAGMLVGTALLASWLPARRAARVDPVEALRWE
jgi:predicted permease